MNIMPMLRSLFLVRLAQRARRSTVLVVLTAVLVSLAVLLGNSCSSDDDYQACRLEEQSGNYIFDKDNVCGCERLACTPGARCFHGDCCDPLLYAEDHERCGCAATCKASEVCHSGQCCDPKSEAAGTRTNCGCSGSCGDRENCQKDATGRYACVCDAELSMADRNNCGCTGEVCDPDTQRCRKGKCECDPLAGPTQQDDADCACRGECPFVMDSGEKVRTAYCYSGVCHCFSADEVICDGKCMKQSDCTCEPEKHMFDVMNCACAGPCAAGDACVNGECTCDFIAHASDNLNCGCSGEPCDTSHGYQCEQGTCTCPAPMLSNNVNCGCSGESCDVANGLICSGGVCVCSSQGICACDPQKHMSDVTNCACNGPCAAGDACVGGKCSCDTIAHANDNLNCGCSGKSCDVTSGFVCSGGVCACTPAHQDDPLHCGCPAVVCDSGGICVGGVCGQCIPVADMIIQPHAIPGSGDSEFDGNGPIVTVSVHISFDPAAHMLKVAACVDMVETDDDWTHGSACQTQTITNVQGSKLVSPADFLLKYTDNNHAQDDAIQKASSLLHNPVVIGVTCMGDTYGDDIYPGCIGPHCSGCTLQFGCVVIAP